MIDMINFPSDSRITSIPLPTKPVRETADNDFTTTLKQAVEQVNQLQNDADTSAQQVVTGELGIHEGMMALTEADLSLRLMLQVRNKVIDAYKEITRMQL